jgi:hypothetical protein
LETTWKQFEKGGDWANEVRNMFIEIDIMKDQNVFYHVTVYLLIINNRNGWFDDK